MQRAICRFQFALNSKFAFSTVRSEPNYILSRWEKSFEKKNKKGRPRTNQTNKFCPHSRPNIILQRWLDMGEKKTSKSQRKN